MAFRISSTSSISQLLLSQIHDIYKQGISELNNKKNWKDGINASYAGAISAFPLSIAAWEAFLNETILSERYLRINKDSKIHSIPMNIIERWDILSKTIIVPDLLYGNTFNKGSQPFQDFSRLVSIRNSLVHFKFSQPNKKTFNAITDLIHRGIFRGYSEQNRKDTKGNRLIDWPDDISTTEGIRWSINTVANMANRLKDFIPMKQRYYYIPLQSNLLFIDDKEAKKIFSSLGVDTT